ncbi:D-alanyl-D-alanine carboxypeptidase family protein [Chlamydia pecorum]|uniref:D-alanyl-D-alanine carboxypeptidase n=1 Tax=Chlamydia pecorum (strain ATCC VR-628 / DSM 29919 / E58) TaxID=331635 RepID=A0AA34WHR7_CHLPE|nr:D-alanyl-D-alanine carboxypeptidase family protein [Chlamydia pecorum]AEB41373.1 D-alanyl-D-alanine carboxypeptidase [Chlamydia pecorum E58]UFP06933.1 D-alanyl-D-alanine carboxypeptidase [Chlamydia pecorum]UJT76748.1 D-alanyl-D-alanine carboxypeptidase [Chlamydia pecorum]
MFYSSFCCFFFLWLCSSCFGAHSFPSTRGTSTAILHADTGKVLYGENLDLRIYPASMTKIATALFILQRHPEVLERLVTVTRDAIVSITPQAKKQSGYRNPPHWLETDGVTIQLQAKEEVSGWDLFHALLLSSANDAANVLAVACCGSVAKCMEQINLFLSELGCKHTHFNNPHGLHHPNHYTTARDLATIMHHALQETKFQQVIKTTHYTMAATNLSAERSLTTTNKLMLPRSMYYYPAALGGKTGTTKSAGKNLVMAAQKNNRKIITVTTGYSGPVGELYQDVIALCEALFHEPLLRKYLISPKESYTLKIKNLGNITIPLSEGVYYDFYASEKDPMLSVSFLPTTQPLPIHRGELLGEWVFCQGEKHVLSKPLYAPYTITPTFLQKLNQLSIRILTSYRTYILLALGILYTSRKTRSRRRRSSMYS